MFTWWSPGKTFLATKVEVSRCLVKTSLCLILWLGILGDPGAAGLFERQKSPWELTLTEPVPEIFEFVPLIGHKNDFSGQSAKRSSRGFILHKSCTLVIKINDIPSVSPPWKLIEEYCFLAPMLRFAISSASLHLFLKLSCCSDSTSQSKKKTTSCKKAIKFPGWTSSLIGQKNHFCGQSAGRIRKFLKLVR